MSVSTCGGLIHGGGYIRGGLIFGGGLYSGGGAYSRRFTVYVIKTHVNLHKL